MKITPLTIDFDVTNAQEVEFVNDLMSRLFGSAPLKTMEAPTEGPVTSTSVPTFNEPTQTAAPVQEFKKEANSEATAIAIAEETIADAIAEVKKEIGKPVTVGKPVKPKTVKEAPQATIEPEPIQAPIEEEKAPEKASNEPLTAKDMQAFMIDLMKTGKITRPQLTDIMLEFGGASLMRIKPEKYELLKQRIETYND
jgi:septal ring-binding cell division protein DamX|nr:MAG TPA: hypothetical protein [Caudoviricetes sp.]